MKKPRRHEIERRWDDIQAVAARIVRWMDTHEIERGTGFAAMMTILAADAVMREKDNYAADIDALAELMKELAQQYFQRDRH